MDNNSGGDIPIADPEIQVIEQGNPSEADASQLNQSRFWVVVLEGTLAAANVMGSNANLEKQGHSAAAVESYTTNPTFLMQSHCSRSTAAPIEFTLLSFCQNSTVN
jgi:hypothetical protein